MENKLAEAPNFPRVCFFQDECGRLDGIIRLAEARGVGDLKGITLHAIIKAQRKGIRADTVKEAHPRVVPTRKDEQVSLPWPLCLDISLSGWRGGGRLAAAGERLPRGGARRRYV